MNMSDRPAIEAILDLARWAPSGDNTQPWRFEIVNDAHVVVHGFDTRNHCVYDLDGRPSQMSIGGLIETVAIAASAHGLRLTACRRRDMAETRPTFDLVFEADPTVKPDPLVSFIARRSVQRRPLKATTLTDVQKAELEASVGREHEVRWIEGGAGRLAMAKLLFRSARLRLVTPEAYRVPREVIEWGAR
jgi:sulfur-carrier protein adenylyltransferase/sulfurtransferase